MQVNEVRTLARSQLHTHLLTGVLTSIICVAVTSDHLSQGDPISSGIIIIFFDPRYRYDPEGI